MGIKLPNEMSKHILDSQTQFNYIVTDDLKQLTARNAKTTGFNVGIMA